MKRLMTVAALLAVAAADIASAQTNGYVLQCLSARAAGQGCVTRAQTDIPTTLFRDPAGIVTFRQKSLEINVTPFIPSLTFENDAQNGAVDGATHIYPMGSLAFVWPISERLSAAIGMEPIGGFGSDFRLGHELLSGTQGQLLDYESYFAAAKFGPTLAYAITPRFSVGASVSATYAQIRKFRMPFTMPPSFAQGMAGIPQLDPQVYGPLFQQFTELTAYGDSKSYDGLTWSADAGVSYHTPTGFAIAASWSPRRKIEVDGGTARIDMTAQFTQMMQAMVMARAQAYQESMQVAQNAVMQQLGMAGLDLQAGMVANYDAATEITLPMTVGAGITLPATRALRLVAEVEWREWSKAENTMPFILTNGENPNINLMVNGDPSQGDFTYPFPLNWEDALSGKLGLAYTLAGGNVLRAGVMTGKNPVPANTVFITFPAISTTAASVGASWKLGKLPIDVAYVHAFNEEITGSAGTHLLGSEYVNSRTTMSENVFTIGTMIRLGKAPAQVATAQARR